MIARFSRPGWLILSSNGCAGVYEAADSESRAERGRHPLSELRHFPNCKFFSKILLFVFFIGSEI